MVSFACNSAMITPLSCYIFDLYTTDELNTLNKVFSHRRPEIEKLVQESTSAGTLYCGKCPDRLSKVQLVWPTTFNAPPIVRVLECKGLHRKHKSLLSHEVGVDISKGKM
jgi:hypothetical protein